MKSFFRCLYYLIVNHFVNHIPSWIIRKFFYRLCGLKIGKNSRIKMNVIVYRPRDISIGSGTIINEGALLDGRGGLIIGNNVNVSMYAILYSGSHKSYSRTFEYYTSKTTVEDCCWIGTRAVVMPGSYIQRNSILSVNSVFKGKSDVGGIYMGIPAQLVKFREFFDDYEEDLVHNYWFE
ncbi:MAG: hypothetical protein IJD40_01325 [Lachnospiraceae bacterium]|nr:hypothetical protein [Lachnospiraceae bacterium]